MYKAIVEVLSSLTPIVISVTVAYIAWQQYLTNKNRLKMELFDRRYKVYDALITGITKDSKDFDGKMWGCLSRKLSATPFLFNSDKDILDFLKKVDGAVLAIVSFRKEHGIPDGADKKLDENQTQAQQTLCENLWKLRPEAKDVFTKYLMLKA